MKLILLIPFFFLKKRSTIIFLALCLICISFFTSDVLATNMRSPLYRIEGSNINVGSARHDSQTYTLSSTLGQTASGEFNSNGYTIKAGFQYIHSIVPFTFSIGDVSIDLGSLATGEPSTDSTTLTVSFGGAGNYEVTAEEIGPLSTLDGRYSIPDTECNGGGQKCTESSSAVWDSLSAYGFGYNMTGEDIPADFIDGTYYRPFPDRTGSGIPQIIMSNNNVTVDLDSKPKEIHHQSTITFKANVSGVQEGGIYSTVINFIATPTY